MSVMGFQKEKWKGVRGYVGGCVGGCVHGCVRGWVGAWVGGWVGGWVDGELYPVLFWNFVTLQSPSLSHLIN